MSNSLPLPLSQQILAWLVQALGLETARSRGRRLSSGTLKGARLGKIIARSWHDLVLEVTALLGLPPVARALWPDLLRRWDAAVSAMRAPALDPRDALLPILRMAVPRIGVRLGALTGLACSASGASQDRWEWLCDPLDPHLPRRVLEGLLSVHRPEWRTWEQRYAGLAGAVDQRTIEKWNAGAVLGPKVIAKIAAAVHPSVEGPLRWARAAMVLRCDLEATVGAAAVASWREAVRHVGSSTLAILTDPSAVSRVAEFWTEEIAQATTPEVSVVLDSLARMAGVESRADDTAPWLQRAAAARYGEISPKKTEIHAVLLLTILQPHVRLLSAALEHGGSQSADALASADLGRWLAGEWELLSLLRHLARGEPIQRQQGSGPRTICPIPDAVRDAAKVELEGAARFIQVRADVARSSEAETTVLSFLLDGNADEVQAARSATMVEFPLAVIDRGMERSMSEEDLRVLPAFALARARRLAEAGDGPGALSILQTLDFTRQPPDAQARRDLAGALMALAHDQLDALYEVVREWRTLRAALVEGPDALALGSELTQLAESTVAAIADVDRLIVGATDCLTPSSLDEPPVEMLVLSFPYLLRRGRLLAALDSGGGELLGAQAIAEVLVAHAMQTPNDGEVAAMLAVSRRLGGPVDVPADIDKRCEHLGTAALRDRWCARLERDLALTMDAGSAGPTPEA